MAGRETVFDVNGLAGLSASSLLVGVQCRKEVRFGCGSERRDIIIVVA